MAGKKHGYGTFFFDAEGSKYYEGEWHDGKREGWGRMFYPDGSVYEGEWLGGDRSGLGLLVLENGNRYEGQWAEDKRHGEGKFFYLDKGKLYKGVWNAGTAKCGEMIDLERESAPEGSKFAIPELKLADPQAVLQDAAAKFSDAGTGPEE
eukprot:m.66507 g.66507  ORF g.66507 m.66507 type:complete len:150 (-) comp13758_c0_seq1:126-575(-)